MQMQIEISPKRVRAYLAGAVVLDTVQARLVWENPHYPAYYIPRSDVREALLVPSEHTSRSETRGLARHFDVRVGERVAARAAWQYDDSPELRSLVRFEWGALDAWFEEEEEVFVHPRDPHKRCDILHSSRHVVVSIGGVVLADTHRPTLLLETGLPPRYYVPKTDVRMDRLTAIEKRTGCAYKGFASYWVYAQNGKVVEPDVAWSYAHPLPDAVKIAGMIGFYNETLDIEVDGVRLDKPITEFSRSQK
ncbi:MAG TPA: DUF427 domain-containing protein [Polyangiaceae bacterium]|jgi:uncharacterized protein (DUF427 family)